MTYQTNCTLPEALLEQIAEQGLAVLPEMIRTIINAAMQIERQQFLNATPYERTAERRGHANGCKPKTVTTRVGAGDLRCATGARQQLLPSSPGKRAAQ